MMIFSRMPPRRHRRGIGRGMPLFGAPSGAWYTWCEAGCEQHADNSADDTAYDWQTQAHWTASGSARPTYRSASGQTIGVGPAWHTDGTAQEWSRTGSTYTGPLTCVFVLRPASISGTRGLVGASTTSFTRIATVGGDLRIGTATLTAFGASMLTAGTAYVVAVSVGATHGARLWINGVRDGSTLSGITSWSSDTTSFVGRTVNSRYQGALACFGFAYTEIDPSADSLIIKGRYGI